MSSHQARVASVRQEVQGFYDRKEKFRIYHGSTNSTRRAKWKRSQIVDASGFSHVLNVDEEKMVAVVEPNVPMDKLIEATLKHGLIPPVVPEFPGITVGGAVVGSAGESSSYKYGLVDRNFESVEIILANGEVVNASETENRELFEGIPSSFGTLGVLTSITLRLIPAKKWIEVTYHSATSFADATSKLLEFSVDPEVDFVDGIVFKRNKAVVVTGKFTDNDGGRKPQQFLRARDQWFYIHARRQFSKSGKAKTDIVSLPDYFFRYERGGFWTGRIAFKYFKVPFDRFSRWVVDPFMHTRVMYHALHESGLADRYVVQDLALPRDKAEEFLDFAVRDLNVRPLWICPLKARPTGIMNPRTDSVPVAASQETPQPSSADPDSSSSSLGKDKAADYPAMINVGVWGIGPTNLDNFNAVNRRIENKVRDLGGIKWLYAQTFYTEDEFWGIYDKEAYDALREKYHASGLPNVFEKVRMDKDKERREKEGESALRRIAGGIWPLRGLYGVYRTVVGNDYLLDRKKA